MFREWLNCQWGAKNLKFPNPAFNISVVWWLKPVDSSRKHDSKLGKSLKWVDFDDAREKW